MNQKKILVIGSNSFSGASYIDFELNKNSKIIGISRSKEYKDFFLPYKFNKKILNFKFYQLNINKNLAKIISIIDDFKPSIVVNFAAQGDVRKSWDFPHQWYTTNFLSQSNLTSELCKKKFIKKYLSISTPEIYGSTKKNVKESSNFIPSTPYALSKLAGDLHNQILFKKYEFPVLFSMSANVYGPYQQIYRIIPRTIIYLKLGKKIKIHGFGKSNRSFINIKDVVRAYSNIINKGKIGERYHVSPSSNNITIEKLVMKICKIMNCDFEKNIELVGENFGQDFSYNLDSSKLNKQTGWKDKINLENGIMDTISWIEKYWTNIIKSPLEYKHKK